MALGCKWCCNSYGIISYTIRINLSQDPMASRDAYQKLCGLIADPGSSHKPTRGETCGLGQKIKKGGWAHELQASSSKP
jgi:hypothetical protein